MAAGRAGLAVKVPAGQVIVFVLERAGEDGEDVGGQSRIVVVDVKFRRIERKRRVDVCQCEQRRRTSGVRGIQVCPDRTCDDRAARHNAALNRGAVAEQKA
jgi:hypothetical protein